MPGMRMGIPKEETYYKYGEDDRKVEIEAIGKHGTFGRIPSSEVPDGEPLTEGRFAYAVKNKPISAGHIETGAYVGEIEN